VVGSVEIKQQCRKEMQSAFREMVWEKDPMIRFGTFVSAQPYPGRAWHAGFCALLAAVFILPCEVVAQTSWQPARNVELIVQAGPGGSSDILARTVARILQDSKLVNTTITVVGKPGAGGALAYNYLTQHAGDGHYLLLASDTLLSTSASGRNAFTYTDFTPLATLCTDYTAALVRADSQVKDSRDLLTRLLKNPQDMSIGLSAAWASANHVAMALAVKAFGGDIKRLKIVVFSASQESVTTLMGGHIDVVSAPVSGIVQNLDSGKIRALAVNSAQRLKGALAGVPTWRESGADAVSSNWRGILGAKNLPEAQAAFWGNVFARFVTTPEWKQYVEKNLLEEYYLDAGETRKLIDTEYRQMATILKEIGLK